MTNSTDNLPQAFSCTWRPKGGATQDCDNAWICFLADIGLQSFIVQEGEEGTRHLHIGVVTKKPMKLSVFNQCVKRKLFSAMESLNDGSIWYMCYKGGRWFKGPGWNEIYCEKEGRDKVHLDIQPNIQDFLVPDIPIEQRKSKAAWAIMDRLSKLYEELKYMDSTPSGCLRFINDLAYYHKRFSLPRSPKETQLLAVRLSRYISCTRAGQFLHTEECEVNTLSRSEYDAYEQSKGD